MPKVEELAPSFPGVKFYLVRADRVGVDAISREQEVKAFPTVLVLRGAKEVARLEGADRLVPRLAEELKKAVTDEDMIIAAALRDFELEEAGGLAEEEEEEELQWTWDPDFASEDIKVLKYGTVVALIKRSDDEEEPGKWQMKNRESRNGDEWEDLDPALMMMLERDYKSGRFYADHQVRNNAYRRVVHLFSSLGLVYLALYISLRI